MNNSKLIQQNSFDTLITGSSRRLSRSCDTAIFNCSQQSILNAMERFVKSVDNMDSTVLVPSKLRDMDLNKLSSNCSTRGLRRKTSQCKVPALLHNTDIYAFYLMLHEVKKELLWGPSTGMSAIASSGALSHSNSNGSLNTIGFSNNYGLSSVPNSTLSSTNNLGSTFNMASLSKCSNSSRNSMDILNGSALFNNNNLINNQRKGLPKEENKLHEKHHSRQPSDDSLASLGSSASTVDIDSESETDSVLADRESTTNSQASDEHTLHLAGAFKHHLQGLHTILHQLADTADFFCVRYQEEIDGFNK